MSRPHPALVRLARGQGPGPSASGDPQLLSSALDHGMHGLLWSWLRERPATEFPERRTLAGIDVVTRARHRRLSATLARVARCVGELGVEVAAIKGVTAEARWYTRDGERPCFDVDVLVHRHAWPRADVILDALDPRHPLRGDINALVRRGYLQSVNVAIDGVAVDLHFDLLKIGIPTRQHDALWARMQRHELPDGTVVLVPDAATSLVHFLVHLTKDGFARLLGFCDVSRVADDPALDWAFVASFLRGEGLETVGASALSLVSDRLGLACPLPVPATRGGLRARAWRIVWSDRSVLLGSTGTERSRRQDLLPFFARGRTTEALAGTLRVLFPHPSTLSLRYPELPGPYVRRLIAGRRSTAARRRVVLRSRRASTPSRHDAAPPALAPTVRASLVRRRAHEAPLWLTVHGRSMGWSIPDATKVLVEPAPSPRRGEVWAFCDDRGEIVVHRCRGRVGELLRFQGDTRVRPDPVVVDEQLIGRVVALDPARSPMTWGAPAAWVQRAPRVAVATLHRTWRRRATRRRRVDRHR